MVQISALRNCFRGGTGGAVGGAFIGGTLIANNNGGRLPPVRRLLTGRQPLAALPLPLVLSIGSGRIGRSASPPSVPGSASLSPQPSATRRGFRRFIRSFPS